MDNPGNPLHILLVDDDFDDRFFFREILSEVKTPLEMTEFEDGDSFLNHLRGLEKFPPPHLVFLDINMPKKNGIECLRELRADHRFNNLPVVMFTTSTNMRDIDDSFQSGANIFIRKAYTFEEGRDSIEKVLEHFRNNGLENPERETFFMG